MKVSKDINVVENFLSLVTGGEKQNLIKRRGVLVCKAKESLVYGSALRVKRLCRLLYLYLWHCCQKCLGRCTPVWKCSTLKWLCLSFPRYQKHFNIVLVSGKCVKICQQYVIDLKMPYLLIIAWECFFDLKTVKKSREVLLYTQVPLKSVWHTTVHTQPYLPSPSLYQP